MYDIIIRKAAESDIDSMCRMLAGLFSIEADFKADYAKQKRALELLLADNSRTALIADCDFLCAGMITGQLVVSTASGGYSVLIEDLFVMPEFRSKGIASMLLRHINLWGRANGAVRAQLVADKENAPALDLYKKLGFNSGRMIGIYKEI